MLGLPEGGCLAEAGRRLDAGAPPSADPDLVDRLSFDSYARSRGDSRVRQSFATWSACMHAAGFSYGDPTRANEDPAFQRPRASAAEKATAVADVGCKRRAGLVSVWATVETAYQRRALRQHAERLELVKLALDARVANAAGLRSGG